MKRLIVPALIVILAGCDSPTGDRHGDWVSDGLKIGTVDSIIAPDSIGSGDTLTIKFVGGMGPGNVPEFSHFETARDSFSIAVTVWAEAFHWEGDIAMPPSWDQLDIRDSLVLSPLFYAPHFVINVHQNNGSVLRDTVPVYWHPGPPGLPQTP